MPYLLSKEHLYHGLLESVLQGLICFSCCYFVGGGVTLEWLDDDVHDRKFCF
jgi:hypothetical protein